MDSKQEFNNDYFESASKVSNASYGKFIPKELQQGKEIALETKSLDSV